MLKGQVKQCINICWRKKMFTNLERTIIAMALFRGLLSGSIEVFAAFLMMRINNIEKALIINTTLAFIGPFTLIVTTAIVYMTLQIK